MSSFVPERAPLLCAGLLSPMLFPSAVWEESRQRLLDLDPGVWRDALVPPGASEEAILRATSVAEAAGELLRTLGLPADAALAAQYATFLAHPRALRTDLLRALDTAWKAGFAEWWRQVGETVMKASGLANAQGSSQAGGRKSDRAGGSSGTGTRVVPVGMISSGHIRIRTRSGTLLLVPVSAVTAAPIISASSGLEPRIPSAPVPGISAVKRPVIPDKPSQSIGQQDAAAEVVPPLALLAGVFRALSDPTRLQIIQVLSNGPSYPSKIAGLLRVSLPTMSHHLSVLKGGGLLRVKREKGFTRVALEPAALLLAADSLKAAIGQTSSDQAQRATRDTSE